LDRSAPLALLTVLLFMSILEMLSASTWFWPKSNGRNVDTQRDAGR
jgi:hypothetical protein